MSLTILLLIILATDNTIFNSLSENIIIVVSGNTIFSIVITVSAPATASSVLP